MLAHELIADSEALMEGYKSKKHALAAAANFLNVHRQKLKNSIHTSMTAEQAKEQSENISILKYEIQSLKGRFKRL